jgi:hypothetical protein
MKRDAPRTAQEAPTGRVCCAITRPREGCYLVAETDATKGPQHGLRNGEGLP